MPNVECVRFTENLRRSRYYRIPVIFRCIKYCAGYLRYPSVRDDNSHEPPYVRVMSAVFGKEVTAALLLHDLSVITLGHYDARLGREGVLPIVRGGNVYGRSIFIMVSITKPKPLSAGLDHILTQFPPFNTLEYYRRIAMPSGLFERLEKVKIPRLPVTSLCINPPVDERTHEYFSTPEYISAQQQALHSLSMISPTLRLVRYGRILWKRDREAEMWTPKPQPVTMSWWRCIDMDRIENGVAALKDTEHTNEVVRRMMARFWRKPILL
ncbi:hypothetical protein PLICRDRAFT_180376 [Plicaturopsis crispa FD-325 SS-3]|uniref:Uncharacterized protein n=1 Tax=Plicaturopsis crispa FD-325 SS-3 TaxID=944288 RepID=A0A0C9SKC0_PLICR|nr:hypothetical protein PLICRDRAFT_180376 [Plicaturopsis crispa FD-325 SS-3]